MIENWTLLPGHAMNWPFVNFRAATKPGGKTVGQPQKSDEYKSSRKESLFALKRLFPEVRGGDYAKLTEELKKPVVEITLPNGRKCKVVLVIFD